MMQQQLIDQLRELPLERRIVALVNACRERDSAPLYAAAGLLTAISGLVELMDASDRERLTILLSNLMYDLGQCQSIN